jgi:DNA polymerase-1
VSEVPNLRINVLRSIDQVSEFWEWLTFPGRHMISFDTETTGLNWWAPDFRVRLIQFGDVTGGWAIPFDGWPALVQGVFDWCSRARVAMVAHNVGYDTLALRKQGISVDWSILHDTFAWAIITGYAEQNRKLKNLAQAEFGQWAGAGERVLHEGMKNAGWDWATVPLGWKPYPLYGVVDTCVTAALWETWAPKRKLWGADHDLEMASLRICGDMMWRGMPVDGSYLFDQIQRFTTDENDVRDELTALGITNPHQNGQLELVLKDAGVELPAKTDKGKVKLDEDVLSHIDHPAAQLTLRFRRLYKTRTSYLEAMFSASGGSLERGTVHPGIKPFEARTGRMSIENPPLQQLPSADEDPTVRRAVIAREDDHVVVTADFGQIELRMWASINDDTAMIAALKEADATGDDFFVAVGRQVYGEPDFKKKDHRRRLLKATTYTKLFGGGIETAAAQAGVNVYGLVPTWKALENTYPSLKTLGADLIKTRKIPGTSEVEHAITSPWGREFKVKDTAERRKLGNYVCQGSAAIALKKAMVGLEAAGFGDYMMLPVHDEVLFSIPKVEADDAMQEIKEVMDSVVNQSTGWKVPVTAEPGAGANWAEAK